ncbi:MAG: ATP-dependent helicase, partial [Methanobrevibacter sp.]|nr:ATP-dependent helicase [Methanobrevibacter sp.]
MAIESDHEEINLNDEQKYVVEYEGDKFLSVQAGPGSGKTRVLVEKVKYMVKEKENPEDPKSFLIITFTEKAAEELRDRLIDGDIDASDVQKMHISTIHSFCLSLLESTGTVGLDVVEGDKLHLFIKKHLEKLGFGDDLNITSKDITNIIDKYNEYSTFKVDTESLAKYLEENFPVDEGLFDFIHEYMEENDGEFPIDEVNKAKYKKSFKNAKYIQIARSYKSYLDLLKKENTVDFNQMQYKALETMNEGKMPDFTNILIDEFQDTDPVQMEIFRKFIESPHTNSLTVVGDLNQSIYGFRGSNKDYFKELREDYPDKFEEVQLSTNYRSTEEIIDLTQDFIRPHYDSPDMLKPAECGSKKHNDV